MLKYINDNYDKVYNICKIYAKRKEKNYIDDVMSSLIDIFIDKNYNISDNEKFFYIIKVVINMVNNKSSKFNKEKYSYKYIDEIYFHEDSYSYEPNISLFNDIYDFDSEYKFENIKKIVNLLYKNKLISKEEKNSFIFYYFPEDRINIKNMNLKQIKDIRNISYRKLEKKTKINYQQIRFKVIKVTNLIKLYINK